MNRVIAMTSKLKYLGLLGLPSLFLDNPIFRYLWMFWLLGLVEILANLPLFLQALKQLFGIPVIYISHGFHLPRGEKGSAKMHYSLPFEGAWTIVNGGTDKRTSHSWGIPTQRYAYDFLLTDAEGNTYSGEKTDVKSYYCYGKAILAPADGEVVRVGGRQPDSRTFGNGQPDNRTKDLRGNFVIIKHGVNEYSFLAHLKPGSILVKEGQKVIREERIALCGNSGNTSEPHIHFHLQDGVSVFASAGLPITFDRVCAKRNEILLKNDPRPTPDEGLLEEACEAGIYLCRGMDVQNRENT